MNISQKKCLNYDVVKNLRKIKFVPNYELPKVSNNNSNHFEFPDYLFFQFISMKRFLNGEINKKGEIYENMSKYEEQNRLKPRKVQHDIKINLNDFIEDLNYYKYEVRNSTFICLFESNRIQILSLKIEEHQFLYKLHQIIKFNKTIKLLKAWKDEHGEYIPVCNFIQENDGSKLYFLYENGLIIISKNMSHFQIDSIISYDNKKFCGLDKYKYKLYILMSIEENYKNIFKVIEINLKNHKIKYYNININNNIGCGYAYTYILSFDIFDKFMLFRESKFIKVIYIYIYDFNQDKIVNKIEKKFSYIEKLKKENECILVYYIYYIDPKINWDITTYFSEYWKFENN